MFMTMRRPVSFKRTRKRWAKTGQSEIVFGAARTWGGKRRNAGRAPKGARAGVPHRKRQTFDGTKYPVEITLRISSEVGSLRRETLKTVILDALRASNARGWIGVTDFSILSNHLHLVVECADEKALSRGMQGLKIRLAKAINRALGRRRGTVFPDRYHSRVLRSPTEVRNSLLYVVNNFRKHVAEQRLGLPNDWIDDFSSGPWFDGWALPPPEPPEARPVGHPKTYLRRFLWRRAGPPFRRYDTPGAGPET